MNAALTSHHRCVGPAPFCLKLCWLCVVRLWQTSFNSNSLSGMVLQRFLFLLEQITMNSEIVIVHAITKMAILSVQPLPLGKNIVVSAVEYWYILSVEFSIETCWIDSPGAWSCLMAQVQQKITKQALCIDCLMLVCHIPHWSGSSLRGGGRKLPLWPY